MEAATQESEQLALLEEQEYTRRIDKLNEQLIKLRPNSQSLRVKDVGDPYRQGDCLFQAIYIHYLERCQQLPGCKGHDCLASVKDFRCAIIKWIKEHLESDGSHYFPSWQHPILSTALPIQNGGIIWNCIAATMLRRNIQVIPMKGNAPIDATPLYGPAGGPILVLG